MQHESRRATMERGFWARSDTLIGEVFEGRGSVSMSGEYFTRDFSVVTLPIPDDDGKDGVDVFYDTIPDYRLHRVDPPRPLIEEWWSDFVHSTEDFGLDLSLIVTQRPVGFSLDETHPEDPSVGLRRLRYEPGFTYRQVVFVDVSGVVDEGTQVAGLKLAREMLIHCAEFMFDERKRRRERLLAQANRAETG